MRIGIILFIITITGPFHIIAQCDRGCDQSEENGEFMFYGEVTSKTNMSAPYDNSQEIEFNVYYDINGNMDHSEITINVMPGYYECNYNFTRGKLYYVGANYNNIHSDLPRNDLYTSRCFGTTILNKAAYYRDNLRKFHGKLLGTFEKPISGAIIKEDDFSEDQVLTDEKGNFTLWIAIDAELLFIQIEDDIFDVEIQENDLFKVINIEDW